MLLDFLPFSRSPGRLRGRSGLLRYVHFLGGIGLVLVLWCVLRYRYGGPATALAWLIGGNALYYLAGVALAYRLRDNRAFCKYLCPVSVPLKVGSRLSLIKVKGDATKCTNCGACTRACPMDVRVPDYAPSGGCWPANAPSARRASLSARTTPSDSRLAWMPGAPTFCASVQSPLAPGAAPLRRPLCRANYELL